MARPYLNNKEIQVILELLESSDNYNGTELHKILISKLIPSKGIAERDRNTNRFVRKDA